MKRIISFFLMCGLLFTFSGCSSQKNNQDILAFFDAFDHTLDADSGHITGQLKMERSNPYAIDIDCQFRQVDQLELAVSTDIAADDNKQEDYLQFYIKDGKTYLNNLGVKTQSVVENIGLQSDSRINMMNPFLSFSDDELCALFTSSKKEGNHYTYTLDPAKLATLLDSLGTVTLDNATLESDIEKDVLKNMTLNAKGKQTVNEDSFDFDLTLRFTIEQLNALEAVQFPSDLDSYVKE